MYINSTCMCEDKGLIENLIPSVSSCVNVYAIFSVEESWSDFRQFCDPIRTRSERCYSRCRARSAHRPVREAWYKPFQFKAISHRSPVVCSFKFYDDLAAEKAPAQSTPEGDGSSERPKQEQAAFTCQNFDFCGVDLFLDEFNVIDRKSFSSAAESPQVSLVSQKITNSSTSAEPLLCFHIVYSADSGSLYALSLASSDLLNFTGLE